jgi:HAMP domain-containing protein
LLRVTTRNLGAETSAGSNDSRGGEARRRQYVPLLHRVAAINALLLLVAVGVTIVVLVPGHESAYRVDEEGVVLVGAVALVVLVNIFLLRRMVRPVQRLTALARTVDLTDPKPPVPDAQPNSEAGELALTCFDASSTGWSIVARPSSQGAPARQML